MTVRRLNSGIDYATWTLAIAALPSPFTANEILEDQNGASYTEDPVIENLTSAGFTLTLRRKTGVAKPTITCTGTGFQPTFLVSNNPDQVIFDGLNIVHTNPANNAGCICLGNDGAGRGQNGPINLLVQNCALTVGGNVSNGIFVQNYGAGNVAQLTVEDTTFASEYRSAVAFAGTDTVANTVTLTRCTGTQNDVDLGRMITTTNGDVTVTVTRCNFDYGTGGAFSMSTGSRSLVASLTNCRFFSDQAAVSTITDASGNTCTFTMQFVSMVGAGSGLALAASASAQTWTVRDNIIASTAAGGAGVRLVDINSAQAVTNYVGNYNDFYLVNTVGNFIGRTNGTDQATLGAWQGGSGDDANSLSTSPTFDNIGTGDLHIPVTSPVVAQGIAVGGVTTDLDGANRPNPPSMGAYEPPDTGLPTSTGSNDFLTTCLRPGSVEFLSASSGPAPSPGPNEPFFWFEELE